jgi:hypothetical protein
MGVQVMDDNKEIIKPSEATIKRFRFYFGLILMALGSAFQW